MPKPASGSVSKTTATFGCYINGAPSDFAPNPLKITVPDNISGGFNFGVSVWPTDFDLDITFKPIVITLESSESELPPVPDWSPWANVRPISGFNAVTVTSRSKNLWSLGDVVVNNPNYGYDNYPLPEHIPPGNYVLSGVVTSTDTDSDTCDITFYKSDTSMISANAIGTISISRNVRASVPFTLTDTAKAVRLISSSARGAGLTGDDVSTWKDMQIESGDVATDYKPYYTPQSVTVQLVDGNQNALTVYGGSLNLTTGLLTVTRGYISSYNGETLPGVWISDRDVYAAGTSPTTGAQVVYELATPLTYQLSPAQITTISGYNQISANSGGVSLTYRADPTLSV